jgi:hypothetical protein
MKLKFLDPRLVVEFVNVKWFDWLPKFDLDDP